MRGFLTFIQISHGQFLTKYRNSGRCEKLVVDKEIFADAKALFLIASNVNAPVPAMTALL